MGLEGKVALISGGARGMGATAEARLFAEEGAKVAIGDVLEEEGRQLEAEINETDGEALFVRLDVTSESDWEQAIAATVSRFGKLDILVNNAGHIPRGARPGDQRRAVGPGNGRQRKERVPGYEARHPPDAQDGWRLDNKHILGRRSHWKLGGGSLPRRQGGGEDL